MATTNIWWFVINWQYFKILRINIIKYKKENGNILELNPLESERIAIYDKDYGKEISPKPKLDYYPIIVTQGKNGLDCPGKITEIKEIS
jgi:hypothetical protein